MFIFWFFNDGEINTYIYTYKSRKIFLDLNWQALPTIPKVSKIIQSKQSKNKLQLPSKHDTRHQLLVEELATVSVCQNVPKTKGFLVLIFYTKQTLLPLDEKLKTNIYYGIC